MLGCALLQQATLNKARRKARGCRGPSGALTHKMETLALTTLQDLEAAGGLV